MIDKTLEELWEIKDSIAREHGYDLDDLVAFLRSRERPRLTDLPSPPRTEKGSRVTPDNALSSYG